MKDERIRRRPAEKAAVVEGAVRCFVITRADLRAELIAARFLTNLDAMTRACTDLGPFIYAVHETRIQPLTLE